MASMEPRNNRLELYIIMYVAHFVSAPSFARSFPVLIMFFSGPSHPEWTFTRWRVSSGSLEYL